MILLKLRAGLGNQLFQYAYARALALRSSKFYNEHIDLLIDTSWFNNISEKDTKREYGLCHFNITSKVLSSEEIKPESTLLKIFNKGLRRLKRDVLRWSDYVYYPSATKPRRNACIEGFFWNTELYFKDYEDEIRGEFTLKDPLSNEALKIENEIISKEVSVLIQVRRGDYINNQHANCFHGAKSEDYFYKAIEYMETELVKKGAKVIDFFVVSDDISWVKNNMYIKSKLGIHFNTTYISKPEIKDYEEIHLMSLCHNFIISNSTFSWWGAWLSKNKNKIVIGPKQWVNDPKINTQDVMPPEWIRV
jgi:hypothetical protein